MDLKDWETFRKTLKPRGVKDLKVKALKLHGLCVFLDVLYFKISN